MNICCILQIETNLYLSYITDYFVVKEETELLLDELVPGLCSLPTTQQHDYKVCEHFHETPPFDSPLPFVAMFFLRPPYSNLLMSPKINRRQVACDTFKTVPTGKSSSLRDILYSINDGDRTTFWSRQFILYPFKIAKKTQAGIKVQSLSSYKVLQNNKVSHSTTVVLENARASNCNCGFQTAYGFVWKACGRKIQCLQFCRPS